MLGSRARWALVLIVLATAGCLGTTDPAEELDEAEANTTDVPLGPEGLSKAVFDELDHVVRNVTSTQDDTELRVDVYKPAPDGSYPTIVVLSPYWSFGSDAKDGDRNGGSPSAYVDYFAPRGYAVALAEMRGTRSASGCWDFGGELDQQDGHDIVEALAKEPFSDGNVGMIGVSHVGMSQIATAITAPESLDTIVPVAAVSDWYRYLHKDGAPYVLNRATPPAYFAVHASPPTDPITDGRITPDLLLTQAEVACPDNVEHLSKSAELDGDKDAYWQERDLIAGAEDITASVFLVHGFQDENVKTDHFLDLWHALPEGIEKRAWFGQWGHAHPPYEEWRNEVHAWFDHELKGVDNNVTDEPRVTVEASDGQARTEADWPSNGTGTRELALSADGRLALAPDDAEAGDVSYLEVPGDDRPMPPTDPAPRRVSFELGSLEEAWHVAGKPQLHVEATLDQPTARWIAVLYEDDGEQVDEITRGYLDARHRDGNAQGEPVPVGEPVTYTVDLFPRDHVLEPGSELRLELLGGDMGCVLDTDAAVFEPGHCEGTGIVPVERVVEHTVHVGPDTDTRLVLPLLEEPGPEKGLTEIDGFLAEQPP